MKAISTITLILLTTFIWGQQKTSLKITDVKVSEKLLEEVDYQNAISARIKKKVEASSSTVGKLVSTETNAFIETLNHCYNEHRPLVINPDMFWLLICQGFSTHINTNPAKYQAMLVGFKGKKILTVRQDSFIKGSSKNPWIDVFPQFTNQIKTDIGASTYNLMVPNFTTTNINSKAAFEITLMNTVKDYYDYELVTLCGIPEITVEGSYEDWLWIKENVNRFNQYNLKWWTSELIPILDKICLTVKGDVDTIFWENIYKVDDQSGGPYINGWVLKFFPYVKGTNDKIIKNKYVNPPINSQNDFLLGLNSNNFLSGISEVNFKWQYYKTTYSMQFIAGFIGINQDSITKALKPEIGWAIVEKSK